MKIEDLELRVKSIEQLVEKYRDTDTRKWRIAWSALECWQSDLEAALEKRANDEFIEDLTELENRNDKHL